MSREDYYCPLCGNKPYKSFVPCRVLEKPVCKDCDDIIREFFTCRSDCSEYPTIIQNLSDYSGLPIEEIKEIWQKEQIITSLLDLRDAVNYCDESGDIWENWALEEIFREATKVIELGRQFKAL